MVRHLWKSTGHASYSQESGGGPIALWSIVFRQLEAQEPTRLPLRDVEHCVGSRCGVRDEARLMSSIAGGAV